MGVIEDFTGSVYYDASLDGLSHINDSINSLVNESKYLANNKKKQLIDCCFFAAKAHNGKVRNTGEPYICHPIKVAEILAKDVKFGVSVLQAAVLHDTIEDTGVTKEQIAIKFGKEIADMVDGVSKLKKDGKTSPQELQAKTFQKLTYAMKSDVRVMMIKLADRMHNMQTLDTFAKEKRHRIAKETIDVYAPIAAKLGMFIFKAELEELVFKQLYPWRYGVILRVLKNDEYRKSIIKDISKELQNKFIAAGITAKIIEKRRNLYCVYEKIKKNHKKRIPLENTSIPLVVIAGSVNDCYLLLGIIHDVYTPVFKKLIDYIANAKINGYQSIHTSVLTKDRKVVNFYIRTKAMHTIAESGIIALLRYHNQSIGGFNRKELVEDRPIRRWIDNIASLSDITTDPVDFYNNVKKELVYSEIQVLTSNNETIGLPKGATVIDFAYHIHSDIGNNLKNAKVNSVEVDNDFILSDGQTVEIFTCNTSSPKSDWLDIVKTARARAALRNYFRNLPSQELADIGLLEIKLYLSKEKNKFGNLELKLEKIARERYGVELIVFLGKISLREIKLEKVYLDLQEIAYKDDVFFTISIVSLNKPGVLADITDIIAKYRANILRIDFTGDHGSSEVIMDINICINFRENIYNLLSSLKSLSDIRCIKNEEENEKNNFNK